MHPPTLQSAGTDPFAPDALVFPLVWNPFDPLHPKARGAPDIFLFPKTYI